MTTDTDRPENGGASECATVKQIAGYLRISEKQVRHFVVSGKLPAIRIGKIVRVRIADFEAFLASHRIR
jgi:excisionase family DNA binding protein